MMNHPDTIDAQVASLRKSLKRTQRLCAGIGLLLLAGVALAAQSPQIIHAQTVVAEAFRLVNADGDRIGALETREDLSGSHGLFLYDDKGRDGARLRMFKGKHPELTFEGRSHTRLRLYEENQSWGLWVMDAEGTVRIGLEGTGDNAMHVRGVCEEE